MGGHTQKILDNEIQRTQHTGVGVCVRACGRGCVCGWVCFDSKNGNPGILLCCCVLNTSGLSIGKKDTQETEREHTRVYDTHNLGSLLTLIFSVFISLGARQSACGAGLGLIPKAEAPLADRTKTHE